MRTILSAQQLAFYKNNGFIEFEIPNDIPFSEKRDQWRESPDLLRFIKKKLGRPALELSHNKKIQVGVSFWITPENKPQKGCPIQEMVSFRDSLIACVMCKEPKIPEQTSSLGILPMPHDSSNVLFFEPKFILDWPSVESDLFFVLFVKEDCRYIQNEKDPETNYLKKLGVAFGDALKNETHPIIF